MSFVSSIKTGALGLYVRGSNSLHFARRAAARNQGASLIAMGAIMALGPMGVAQAQTIESTLGGLGSTITSIVNFIMNLAVVIGVGAILYGIKLVIDKSNDRENVKNGHIVYSFVGGALMCMLWFVVRMMSNTVAGGEGNIGQEASW